MDDAMPTAFALHFNDDMPRTTIRLPAEAPPAAELPTEVEAPASVEQISTTELRLVEEARRRAPLPQRIIEAAPLIKPSLVTPVHVNGTLFRQFLDALSLVACDSATVPIARNVHMTYSQGEILLEATDHSVWAVARLSAQGGADGFECVLPLTRARNVIRRIAASHPIVPLGIDKEQIHIGSYSLPHGGSIRDFPLRMTLQPEELKAALPAHLLESILERVASAVAMDHERPSLRGVLLDFNEGVAVATDGHRLHHLVLRELQIATRNSYRARPSVTLSLPAFRFLRAVADREWVGLMIHERMVSAAGGDFGMMATPLEGPFAEWRSVVPSYSGYWIVDKNALLEALGDTHSDSLRLALDSLADRLIVSVRCDAGESWRRALTAHRSGGPATFCCALDPRYLRDAVAAAGGGLVRLGFPDGGSPELPITVQGEDDDFLAVIMPRHLD